MRDRKEIIEELYEGNEGREHYWKSTVLEVLLDIRDLLERVEENTQKSIGELL